jgi:hypothetical protein
LVVPESMFVYEAREPSCVNNHHVRNRKGLVRRNLRDVRRNAGSRISKCATLRRDRDEIRALTTRTPCGVWCEAEGAYTRNLARLLEIEQADP